MTNKERLRDELVLLSKQLQGLLGDVTAVRNRCLTGKYTETDAWDVEPGVLEALFKQQAEGTIAMCLLIDSMQKLQGDKNAGA